MATYISKMTSSTKTYVLSFVMGFVNMEPTLKNYSKANILFYVFHAGYQIYNCYTIIVQVTFNVVYFSCDHTFKSMVLIVRVL